MAQQPIYFAGDEKLLAALSEPLRKAGVLLQTFASQAALLAACETVAPGAVLLGARLPDGTAVTASQALAPKRIPCVVILSPSQGASRAAILRSGLADVAFSPIRPRQLGGRLAELAGTARRPEVRQPADARVRVTVGGRSVEGRLVEVSRDAAAVALAVVPQGGLAELQVDRAAGPLVLFATMLDATTDGPSTKVQFRLLGLLPDEEAAVLALAQAAPKAVPAAGVAPTPSVAVAPAVAPVARDPSPTLEPAAGAVAGADLPTPPPVASTPPVEPTRVAGAPEAPSVTSLAAGFAAELFGDATPAGPSWPRGVPTLDDALTAVRAALAAVSAEGGVTEGSETPAPPPQGPLEAAARTVVRTLTAQEREAFVPVPSAGLPAPQVVPGNVDAVPPAPAAGDAPAAARGPDEPTTTAPATGGASGASLDAEVAGVLRQASAHRVRLLATALAGRALLEVAAARPTGGAVPDDTTPGQAPKNAAPVVAEDVLSALVADAEAWGKTLRPLMDKALVSGGVAVLRELNAVQGTVTRAVVEVRNLARRMKGESDGPQGGALDVAVEAANAGDVARPKPSSGVGEVRIHAGVVARVPSTMRWGVPLLVVLVVTSLVVNVVVFRGRGGTGAEPANGVRKLTATGPRGVLQIGEGFFGPGGVKADDLLALARQQGMTMASIVGPRGEPLGLVDVEHGHVTLMPQVGPGAPGVGPGAPAPDQAPSPAPRPEPERPVVAPAMPEPAIPGAPADSPTPAAAVPVPSEAPSTPAPVPAVPAATGGSAR